MKTNIFFDAKEAVPALPQIGEGTQRIFNDFFAAWRLCVIYLLGLLWYLPVFAQTAVPQVSVTVRVLDADGQPVTEIRVELVIFQYAASVEPFPAGGCETDETGSCVIWTDLPPSSGADWYEGVVYVSDLGRQLVGWQGDETLIVILLTPDGIVATAEPHLHGPYTDEQYAPTEGSPVSSQTITQTATPTGTPFPTDTVAPTFTPTLIPTPTQPYLPDGGESTFPIGWVIVSLLFVGGLLWWVLTRRSKRHG